MSRSVSDYQSHVLQRHVLRIAAIGCFLVNLTGNAFAQVTPPAVATPAVAPAVESPPADVDNKENAQPNADADTESENQQNSQPGINDRFLDPQLDVSEWLGRFEIESREVYAARTRVLDACGIKPGMAVADIGAGTGFYSRLFAAAAGDEGWVYAVDISPRFLEHINHQAQQENLRNLTCVLCTDRSSNLPPNSVDVVFICDTYHHFEHPQLTLASIHQALKPGGRLIVIDFERIPGVSREFILGHVRAGKEVFQSEIVEAGFSQIDEVRIPTFQENYLLRFQKESAADAAE